MTTTNRKRNCEPRTGNYEVRLICTITLSSTVDVTAQSSEEAKQLAANALRDGLSEHRPNVAESWDVDVEAVDVADIDQRAAD